MAEPTARRRLEVPEHLHRNSPRVAEVGVEETGLSLLRLIADRVGVADLSSSDVLDVGCGVRLTQTILNQGVDVRSYTGIDVERKVIDFLLGAAASERLRFAHWDVHNEMYNPTATVRMDRDTPLPVSDTFDVIVLLSVFTHLEPPDADAMLAILRRYVRPGGKLLFSAFLDPGIDRFADKVPGRPLLRAHFAEPFLRKLIADNGWRVVALHAADPMGSFIQDHFVCAPV